MRIGIEAQRIFREKKHGMDIFALQLIKTLQQTDSENEYFIFVKPGPDRCLESTDNFHIVELPGLTYFDWEQIVLPIAIRKYDLHLLHCTSNTAPIFAGVPTVITLHDIIYLFGGMPKGTLYQKLGYFYRKYVVPFVAHKTSRLVTVSEFEKRVIEEKLGGEKLEVVYNGVNERFFTNSQTSVLALPEQYFFFLGNQAEKKNMKNMLLAFNDYCKKTANPIPLVIAETNEKQLQKILEQLSIGTVRQHIQLIGYIVQDELPGIYSGATVFVYPSLRESFGIPILEAMASGTPVITSTYSSMPEVAGDAACLVASADHMELSTSLSSLAQNKEARQEMSTKGLDRAQGFKWSVAARRYAAIYEEVVVDNTLKKVLYGRSISTKIGTQFPSVNAVSVEKGSHFIW